MTDPQGGETGVPRVRHWRVEVYRDGESVVNIESNCLSGRDLQPGDEDVIRDAAMNLLGFIGEPKEAADQLGVPTPSPETKVRCLDCGASVPIGESCPRCGLGE